MFNKCLNSKISLVFLLSFLLSSALFRRRLVKSNTMTENTTSPEMLKEIEDRRNLLLQAAEKRIHPSNQ